MDRINRVNELIKEELGKIFLKEMEFPKEIQEWNEPSRDIAKPFTLLVGMTSNNRDNLQKSLLGFEKLVNHSSILSHEILILENTDDNFQIRPIIQQISGTSKLNVRLIDIDEQQTDINNFPFQELFPNENIENKSIAFSRSLLQW